MCDGRDSLSIKPPLGLKFYEKNLYRKVLEKSVTTVTLSVFYFRGKIKYARKYHKKQPEITSEKEVTFVQNSYSALDIAEFFKQKTQSGDVVVGIQIQSEFLD